MKRPCGSNFSWQETRHIHDERNDKNKNNFQVHYNRKTIKKTESHIETA
jgi:hypothetical protein